MKKTAMPRQERAPLRAVQPRATAKPTPQVVRQFEPGGVLIQRALLAPRTLRPADGRRLQAMLGNAGLAHLANIAHTQSAYTMQAKLRVGPADDAYEHEADRMAARALAPQRAADGQTAADAPLLQRGSAAGSEGFVAGTGFEQHLARTSGSGDPLPRALRMRVEPSYGANLENVRIHDGPDSAALAESIQAKAFTHGHDIHFNAGEYDPNSGAGQQLIAHELTHVVQQGAAAQGPIQRAPQDLIQRTGKNVASLIAFFENVALMNAAPQAGEKALQGGQAPPTDAENEALLQAAMTPSTQPQPAPATRAAVLSGQLPAPPALEVNPLNQMERAISIELLKDGIGQGHDAFTFFSRTTEAERTEMLTRIGWLLEDIEFFEMSHSASVDHLDTDDQRAPFVLHPGAPITQGASTAPFDTTGLFANGVPGDNAIFVMDKNGIFYAARHRIARFDHSSFLGGGDAATAGTLEVKAGKLKTVTSKSDHATPGPAQMRLALRELRDAGVSMGGVTYRAALPQKPLGEPEPAEQFLAREIPSQFSNALQAAGGNDWELKLDAMKITYLNGKWTVDGRPCTFEDVQGLLKGTVRVQDIRP